MAGLFVLAIAVAVAIVLRSALAKEHIPLIQAKLARPLANSVFLSTISPLVISSIQARTKPGDEGT